MLPKRKYPFSAPSHGGRDGCKAPRLQKRAETEEPPVDLSDPSSLPLRTIEGVRKTVEEKVEHGKKHVFRALKKAKGFEKQKLVKRLKIARDKRESVSVGKLELEFEVLKTEEINLNSLALNHILRTLTKSKYISTSLLFPPWLMLQKEPEGKLGERETAKRNIIARLYNSSPVKEEMAVVLGNVRKAMGVDEGRTSTTKKEAKSGKWQMKEDDEDLQEGGEGESEDEGGRGGPDEEVVGKLRGLKVGKIRTEASVEQTDEDVEEEWGGIADSAESEDAEMDLDAFAAKFEDRIAGSSDGEDDQGPLQRGENDEWSGEEEDGDEDEDEDEDEDTQNVKKSTTKIKSGLHSDDTPSAPALKSKISAKPKPVSSTTSTFLPTLMSGYISGSDSDIDADYYKDKKGRKKGPAEPKERKNRMGQQARRALWEKKFGKNANHVKEEEAKQGRKNIEKRINQGKGGDGKKRDGAEKKGKGTETEGPLHPSWEAARKAKEQQAKVQEAVMGKPMGKKIVFD